MTGFRERILSSAEEHRSRVVLALDFSDPYERRLARAEEALEATKGRVAAVKVNHHLLLPFGLQGLGEVIGICKKARLPLIADLKMNDIEATNLNAVDSLSAYGFDAVIANPFVGREEGLGKAVERVGRRSAVSSVHEPWRVGRGIRPPPRGRRAALQGVREEGEGLGGRRGGGVGEGPR
jgi:orotidine-5'-phosphate decarboxylase